MHGRENPRCTTSFSSMYSRFPWNKPHSLRIHIYSSICIGGKYMTAPFNSFNWLMEIIIRNINADSSTHTTVHSAHMHIELIASTYSYIIMSHIFQFKSNQKSINTHLYSRTMANSCKYSVERQNIAAWQSTIAEPERLPQDANWFVVVGE